MASHPFHAGELAAQMRFNPDWDDRRTEKLGRIVGDALDQGQTRFIHGLTFFFLATADAGGHCDCSFKGSEPGPEGDLPPAARVAGPRRLLFPDYAGNRMYNSLGNILVNPQVGMIFIDFSARRRLRVNGPARVLESGSEWADHWPGAPRAVEVTVEQAFWNCSKRVALGIAKRE